MKESIIIVGGGLLQVPVIQKAKDLGLYVIVFDYNTKAPGMAIADVPISVSTRDITNAVRKAEELQKKFNTIKGVLTVGTDVSVTVASIAKALNLPDIKVEDAEAASNKIKMRERFKEHNVPIPKFFPIREYSDVTQALAYVGFPLVVKPADSMGARGVSKVERIDTLFDACKHAMSASTSGRILIEEYMDGPELSIDMVVYNGTITVTGVADRIIAYPPYFVEIGHTMPSQLPVERTNEAVDVMIQGIRALGITNGFAKGDIKLTPEGAKIVELAARLSGGFMSTHTYPLSSGVDLMKIAIQIAMGEHPTDSEPTLNRVAIERALITAPGIIRSISGLEEARKIKGIVDIILNVQVGDMIGSPRSNVEKTGHIIAVGDILEEAEDFVNKCKELIKIEV